MDDRILPGRWGNRSLPQADFVNWMEFSHFDNFAKRFRKRRARLCQIRFDCRPDLAQGMQPRRKFRELGNDKGVDDSRAGGPEAINRPVK